MKCIVTVGLVFTLTLAAIGQRVELSESLFNSLKVGTIVPEGLLAKRSVVLYNPTLYPYQELVKIQQAFQRTGIDAVAYFTLDMVFANPDAIRAASDYYNKRGISFLILAQRKDSLFSLLFARFSGDKSLIDTRYPAWHIADTTLNRLLKQTYRTAIQSQPKKNLLINDIPETDFVLPMIRGRSFTSFPLDLKIDRLAVPLFDNAILDSSLVHSFQKSYAMPFDTVRQVMDIDALRTANFLYVLKYVYAREATIRNLLKSPGTVPAKYADKKVYKFYVQSLVSGNIFLGTTWDADADMQTSLLNYIHALNKELGI